MPDLMEEQRAELRERGFSLLPGVLNLEEIDSLLDLLEVLWEAEGDRAGIENYIETNARRLANLYNKGDAFRSLYTHPLVLKAARVVIGPDIRLSMLNARDVPPGAESLMPLHCDVDDGLKPGQDGHFAFTAIWMLDDFTRQNGTTRIVPGSHLSPALPEEVLEDPGGPHPDEVLVEGKAGDVLALNGHCWHAGTSNRTESSRRAVLVHYIRAGYPRRLEPARDLSPEVVENASPLERRLLGLTD